MKVLLFVLTLTLPLIQAGGQFLKPYEVLLYSKENSVDLLNPICFGNILQSHIILTAASCLRSDLEASTLIDFTNLTVAVPRENNENLLFSISNIYTYPKSDTVTDHDVALLNLSTSLPLSGRNDVEWIVLADHPNDTQKCKGNAEAFDVVTSLDKKPNFRGYGTLCESELVAILTAAFDKNEISTEYQENVYYEADIKYTEVYPYFWWIFNILQKEELKDISDGNFKPSLPYRESKTAAIVDNNTSSESLNNNTSRRSLNNNTPSEFMYNNNASSESLNNITSSESLRSTGTRIKIGDVGLWILIFGILISRSVKQSNGIKWK